MKNLTMTRKELEDHLMKYTKSVGRDSFGLVKQFQTISDLCSEVGMTYEEIMQAFEEFEGGRKVVLHVPVAIPIPFYILPYMNVTADKTLSVEEKADKLSRLHIHLFRDLAELLEDEMINRKHSWKEETKNQLIKEGMLCHMTKKADG